MQSKNEIYRSECLDEKHSTKVEITCKRLTKDWVDFWFIEWRASKACQKCDVLKFVWQRISFSGLFNPCYFKLELMS